MSDDSGDVIDTAKAVGEAVAAAAARMGLQQPKAKAGPGDKARQARAAAPKRDGPLWKSVTIVREHETNPALKCNNCDKSFCGGATRIESHICNDCTCDTEAFLDMKQKVLEAYEEKQTKKKQKLATEEVNAAAYDVKPNVSVKQEKKGGQQTIKASLNASAAQEVDDAIAECFYALNITPSVAEKPLFKTMIQKLKTAPASYVPPTRHRLMDDLLDSTTARLKASEAPLREAVVHDGGTVVSDGWDDIEKNHLINFLVGTAKGMFFDGTIKLSSEDSEDASRVAQLIIDQIYRVGCLTIVQVVTDTCSVMKAAWKLIEKEFPWITCTCCGPHVISLELHDIAKIPYVAKVIEAVGKILDRFWGRTRWARTKLREVAAKNHKKKIGLYRAKATRFAGKVREMGRVLRLKADLQEVVISAAYAQQKWPKKKKDTDAEEQQGELDGEGGVKKILLDEDGFWKPLVAALKVAVQLSPPRLQNVPLGHLLGNVPEELFSSALTLATCSWPRARHLLPCCLQIMTPIVKLLRLMDGEKPAMGKVYDRMFMIGQKIDKSDVEWKEEAAKMHAERWEYLHSEFHAAGYALDPEFMEMANDVDEATQNGLINVIEKICYRDVLAEAENPNEARKTITMDSAAVQTRVEKTMEQLAKYQQREGIFTKLFVVNNAKTMAPASWWATYGKHLPQLASVARRVLAQPCCASAAERNWSVYGQIKTKARSRMGHSTGDKLVYCHEALHMRAKLQDAGYTQHTDKWDSDSDSDESDDEQDLMV